MHLSGGSVVRSMRRFSGFWPFAFELALQLHHPAEPALVVLTLVAHVGCDLGMRKNEEAFCLKPLDYRVRAFLHRKHAVEMLRAPRTRAQQRRINALRT